MHFQITLPAVPKDFRRFLSHVITAHGLISPNGNFSGSSRSRSDYSRISAYIIYSTPATSSPSALSYRGRFRQLDCDEDRRLIFRFPLISNVPKLLKGPVPLRLCNANTSLICRERYDMLLTSSPYHAFCVADNAVIAEGVYQGR